MMERCVLFVFVFVFVFALLCCCVVVSWLFVRFSTCILFCMAWCHQGICVMMCHACECCVGGEKGKEEKNVGLIRFIRFFADGIG